MSGESVFGYANDFSGTYFGHKYTAGSEATPMAVGDVLIAMQCVRVNDAGFTGTFSEIEGISTDGTDWIEDDGDFGHDVPTGNYWAISAWHKVWTADDDPTGYQVKFDAYDSSGTGGGEGQLSMYAIHGAGGSVTFHGIDFATAYTDTIDGATQTRDWGDGNSWSYTETVGEHPPGSGTIFGYHSISEWFYWTFGGGDSLYGAALFGIATPFIVPSFEVFDSNYQISGDTHPDRSFTFSLWQPVPSAGVRANRRPTTIRRISVS